MKNRKIFLIVIASTLIAFHSYSERIAIYFFLDTVIGKFVNKIDDFSSLDCVDTFLYSHRYLNEDGEIPSVFNFSYKIAPVPPSVFEFVAKNNVDTRMLCGDVSWVGLGLANQNDCAVRVYDLEAKTGNYDTHVFGEVFFSRLNKYVVVDPTFKTLYSCEENNPMSMNELLQKCFHQNREIFPVNKDGTFNDRSSYSDYYITLEDLFHKWSISIELNTK